MSKVDISSEAVDRAIAMAGLHGLHGTQATLRAQAERIKGLEDAVNTYRESTITYRDAVFSARNDALREALSHKWLCFHKCDEEIEVVNAEDIIALIEGDTND